MLKKKKSKTEKKYDDIRKILENSDKFYRETTKPDRSDTHAMNATKVLMQPEGTCSTDGARKLYESWPEYCKTHKFMSSLTHAAMPDIILSDEMMLNSK